MEKNMKKGLIIILILFCSCVSSKPIRGVQMSSSELETLEIIGFVETKFEALRNTDERALLQKGYDELMKVAHKQYHGKIGIRNIILKRKTSGKNFTAFFGFISVDYYINVEARGAVIKMKE
jgi:hypothetical protein